MSELVHMRSYFHDSTDLSFTEEEDLFAQAKSSISKLPFFSETPSWSVVPVRNSEKNEVQLSEQSYRIGDSIRYTIRAIVKIPARMEEMVQLLMTNESRSFGILMQQLFGTYYLDGRELFNRSMSNETLDNISVKWVATNSRHPFLPNSDLCLLDYSCIMVDDWSLDERRIDPHPMFVKVVHSVELDGIPTSSSPNFVSSFARKHVEPTGILVRAAKEEGLLEVRFVGSIVEGIVQIPYGGASQYPNFFDRSMLRSLALNLNRLETILLSRRLQRQSFCTRAKWIPDEYRDVCKCCKGRFGIISHRRRHHCRICGEVVCGRCCPKKDVNVEISGMKRVRICDNCIHKTRQNPSQGVRSLRAQHNLSFIL